MYHQRDSPFIRHPVELKNFFNSQHQIQKFFGLLIPSEFWNLKFKSTHLLIGVSLHKVLTSLRSALSKRVSRSILIVMTKVGYLDSEIFNFNSAINLPSTSTNRGLGWQRQLFDPPLMCRKQIAGCSLRVVSVCTYTSFMSAK
jgi:hypothetical protein